MDPAEKVHPGRRLDTAQDGRGCGDSPDVGLVLDEEQWSAKWRSFDAGTVVR